MARIAEKTAILILLVFLIPACSLTNDTSRGPGQPADKLDFENSPSSTLLSTQNPSAASNLGSQTQVSAGTSPAPVVEPTQSQSVHSQLNDTQSQLLRLYEAASPGVVLVKSDNLDGITIGSGFFIDKKGHIVTSYHVVKSESGLEVATSSSDRIPAELVGRDPVSDLAVLKVDFPPDKISPLKPGDSDLMQVGQVVSTIGNPFGLQGSMTTGIVSGLGQGLRYFRESLGQNNLLQVEYIFTDAAVNPGSSGGPLFNLDGEVIGINSSVVSDSKGNLTGISLVLPMDIALPVIMALIEEGRYQYPYTGISSLDELNRDEWDDLGVGLSKGIYITEIEPGSPADRAGLKAASEQTAVSGLKAGGDIILAVDGQVLDRFDQMNSYLIKYKQPGDLIMLTVLREGQQQDIELRLDKTSGNEIEDW